MWQRDWLIRLRQHPMIFDWSFLTLSDLQRRVRRFAEQYVNRHSNAVIVDIGAGKAPYRPFFWNVTNYTALDLVPDAAVDVIGDVHRLPFGDGSIDAILCTQVLEHTSDFRTVIHEAYRVLRTGGVAFFSFPFAANIHGRDDRWRFSRYTIEQEFRTFDILAIHGSGGTFTSVGQYLNNFLAAIPLGRYIFIPAFLLINTVSRALDATVRWVLIPPFRLVLPLEAYRNMRFALMESLPLNYAVIVRKGSRSPT